MGLILAIGNYLNYGHKRNGGAKGVRLDIFDKLRNLKANKCSAPDGEKEQAADLPNKHTDKYTLLMYLVDMVNKQYPDLSDCTKIFKNCKACQKIKIDELEKEVASIDKRVKNVRKQMKIMSDEKLNLIKKKNKKNEEEKSEEKETWQEPSAPPDVYTNVMSEFLNVAESNSKQLMDTFNETKTNCESLVTAMGEKLTDKYTMSDFWAALNEIRGFWEESQSILKKIEDDKAKLWQKQKRNEKNANKKRRLQK